MLAAPALAQQQEPFEPEGYRTDNYRAPVPATLEGARVLTTAEAEAIWRAKSGAFIDVLPRAAEAEEPSRRHGVARYAAAKTFPAASGCRTPATARLPPAMDDYFQRGLAHASHGDKAALLVIYCLADCWMSWNAAKRALAYGYSNVAWYPEGTDGWEHAKLPTEESQPEPRPEQ